MNTLGLTVLIGSMVTNMTSIGNVNSEVLNQSYTSDLSPVVNVEYKSHESEIKFDLSKDLIVVDGYYNIPNTIINLHNYTEYINQNGSYNKLKNTYAEDEKVDSTLFNTMFGLNLKDEVMVSNVFKFMYNVGVGYSHFDYHRDESTSYRFVCNTGDALTIGGEAEKYVIDSIYTTFECGVKFNYRNLEIVATPSIWSWQSFEKLTSWNPSSIRNNWDIKATYTHKNLLARVRYIHKCQHPENAWNTNNDSFNYATDNITVMFGIKL